VANGFGPDFDWLRNIQAKSDEEVTVGREGFVASHRFLSEDAASRVIERYEYRNRFIAPVVRAGFTWLLGWSYRATESDRRRLVSQIPLLAFRPRPGVAVLDCMHSVEFSCDDDHDLKRRLSESHCGSGS
jgi:hypothetical protein